MHALVDVLDGLFMSLGERRHGLFHLDDARGPSHEVTLGTGCDTGFV